MNMGRTDPKCKVATVDAIYCDGCNDLQVFSSDVAADECFEMNRICDDCQYPRRKVELHLTPKRRKGVWELQLLNQP